MSQGLTSALPSSNVYAFQSLSQAGRHFIIMPFFHCSRTQSSARGVGRFMLLLYHCACAGFVDLHRYQFQCSPRRRTHQSRAATSHHFSPSGAHFDGGTTNRTVAGTGTRDRRTHAFTEPSAAFRGLAHDCTRRGCSDACAPRGAGWLRPLGQHIKDTSGVPTSALV